MAKSKYILLSCLVLILTACTAPEKEDEGGEIMEYVGDEETDSVAFEDDYEDENEFDTKWTQVVEANIGLYQELAIMVLQEQDKNDDGTVNVTGYYFYVKHQKNLDLEGVKDPLTGRYVLTESYKGKTTGFMEFTPGDPDDSFWSPASNTKDEQDLNARRLTGGEPYEMTMIINHDTYEYKHELQIYNGTDWDIDEATDELKVTWINEEYMAFDLNVTRHNAHLGSVCGVARYSGNKAKFLKEGEWDNCELDFTISKNEITVEEIDCDSWHGANASFDGTYVKK